MTAGWRRGLAMTAGRLRGLVMTVAAVAVLSGCASSPVIPKSSVDVTVPSRGVSTVATWVVPEHREGEALPLVILIHGHGGTRHEAGGFTRLADQLADAGYASIRMDFPGCGDSSEPFFKNNLRNMLADVRAARDWARARTTIDSRRIGLVGFSMGGRLAAMLSRSDRSIDTMVLWAAAVGNGPGRMVDYLGGAEAWEESKAIAARDGFAPFTTFWGQHQQLGPEWFEDLESSRPLDDIAAFEGSLHLVHGSADAVVPLGLSAAALGAAVSAETVSITIIDGADHGFGLFAEEDRYSQKLIDATTSFIEAEL
ncbi:MAG: alpha/beta fold hydrolase [Pseudomonadota bacterium]